MVAIVYRGRRTAILTQKLRLPAGWGSFLILPIKLTNGPKRTEVFTPKEKCPLNSPELNPLDYSI